MEVIIVEYRLIRSMLIFIEVHFEMFYVLQEWTDGNLEVTWVTTRANLVSTCSGERILTRVALGNVTAHPRRPSSLAAHQGDVQVRQTVADIHVCYIDIIVRVDLSFCEVCEIMNKGQKWWHNTVSGSRR